MPPPDGRTGTRGAKQTSAGSVLGSDLAAWSLCLHLGLRVPWCRQPRDPHRSAAWKESGPTQTHHELSSSYSRLRGVPGQMATKQGPSPYHSGCPHGILLLPGVGGSSADKPLGSLWARPHRKPHVGSQFVSGERQGRFRSWRNSCPTPSRTGRSLRGKTSGCEDVTEVGGQEGLAATRSLAVCPWSSRQRVL